MSSYPFCWLRGVGVRIRVQVSDDTGADTGAESRALYDWLAAEPEIRTGGQLTRETAEPGAGQMGEVLTAISLIVGSGVSLGQLLVSIAAWRATRPRPYRVSVELADRTIAIETTDADEALSIARRLEAD
jgi:hypothetical protein